MKTTRNSHLQPNIRTTASGAKIINETVFSRVITDTLPKPQLEPLSVFRENTADSGVFTYDDNVEENHTSAVETVEFSDSDQGSPQQDFDIFDTSSFAEHKERPNSSTSPDTLAETRKQKVFRIRNGVVTSELLDLSEPEMAYQVKKTTDSPVIDNDVDNCKFCDHKDSHLFNTGGEGVFGTRGVEERQELQCLTQRLSSYIQHVQSANAGGGSDSSSLLEAMKILEDELANIKVMYERELDALRGQLEEASKEKAHLAAHTQKYQDAFGDLELRLAAETDKSRKMGDEVNRLQQIVMEKENELAKSENTLRNRVDDSDAVQMRYQNTLRDCESWKRRYDEELKQRQLADDNKHQLEQKISFETEIFSKENTDLKDRLTSASNTILALEAKIRELSHSDTSLHDMLQRVRDAAEAELRRYQDESAHIYEANLTALKAQLDEEGFKINSLNIENNKLQAQIGDLSAKLRAMESQVAALNDQNRSLESLLAQERNQSGDNVRLLEKKLRELQETLFMKMKEINAARDAQLPLKAEIEAFRVLLETEENRLKLPLGCSHDHQHGSWTYHGNDAPHMHAYKTSSSMVPVGPIKAHSSLGNSRSGKVKLIKTDDLGQGKDYFDEMFSDLKHDPLHSVVQNSDEKQVGWTTHDHTTSTASATGSIKILDVNHEGKYIRLVNRSDKDVEIGGYILQQNVGGHPVAVFRFPPQTKLKSQGVVTVWAGGSIQVSPQPPSDFVWREQKKWGTGPECTTIFCKPNGQAVAWTTSAHRVRRDPYKATSTGNSSPDADYMADYEDMPTDERTVLIDMDVNAPKPEPVYLKRERVQAPLLTQQKHPHGHSPPQPVHPSTGQARQLNYGNDHSSRNKQARSQSSRPDPIPGAPYAGASAQRMGSATLRSYTPPTIKGSGAIANKAAGTIRYGPNTPFLSPLQQDFSKAVDSRATSLAHFTA